MFTNRLTWHDLGTRNRNLFDSFIPEILIPWSRWFTTYSPLGGPWTWWITTYSPLGGTSLNQITRGRKVNDIINYKKYWEIISNYVKYAIGKFLRLVILYYYSVRYGEISWITYYCIDLVMRHGASGHTMEGTWWI